MLPTNEKSNITSALHYNNILRIVHDNYECNSKDGLFKHIYIVSDDELKDGNWHLDLALEGSNFMKPRKTLHKIDRVDKNCKKIIATTDESFYEGKLCLFPKLSRAFIEKFVEEYNKGNHITKVMVEYNEYDDGDRDADGYPISKYRPKVNFKDNTITIKKVKDSWNRDEVIELLTKAIKDCEEYELFNHWSGKYRNLDKWIEENI